MRPMPKSGHSGQNCYTLCAPKTHNHLPDGAKVRERYSRGYTGRSHHWLRVPQDYLLCALLLVTGGDWTPHPPLGKGGRAC